MERRGFLKALTTLIIANAIPDSVTKGVEFVEKKIPAPVIDRRYINHTTIQRRTVIITGSGMTEGLWFKFEDYAPMWTNQDELMEYISNEREKLFNSKSNV